MRVRQRQRETETYRETERQTETHKENERESERDRQTEGQTKRQRNKGFEWAGSVCVAGGGGGRDFWNQMNQSLFKGVFSGFLADLVKAISYNNNK